MTNDKNAKDEFLGLSIDEIVERVNEEVAMNPAIDLTSGHPRITAEIVRQSLQDEQEFITVSEAFEAVSEAFEDFVNDQRRLLNDVSVRK